MSAPDNSTSALKPVESEPIRRAGSNSALRGSHGSKSPASRRSRETSLTSSARVTFSHHVDERVIPNALDTSVSPVRRAVPVAGSFPDISLGNGLASTPSGNDATPTTNATRRSRSGGPSTDYAAEDIVEAAPSRARMSRAQRSMLAAFAAGNTSGPGPMQPDNRERYRTTSGSEVGLELDPGQAKVVEVYGFVGWIATYIAWIGYLLWAYLPESVLHQVGVTYYPDKYWALAGPAGIVMLVSFYATIYGAIGLANNPHVDSFDSLGDGYSKQLQMSQEAQEKAEEYMKELRSRRQRHQLGLPSPTNNMLDNYFVPMSTDEVAETVVSPSKLSRCKSAPALLISSPTNAGDGHRLSSIGSNDTSSSEESGGDSRPGKRRRSGSGHVESSRQAKRVASKSIATSTTPRAAQRLVVKPLEPKKVRMLPSGIDMYMSTPDIADLPISMVNKLQFFVSPKLHSR